MKRAILFAVTVLFVVSCSHMAFAISISGTLPDATVRERYSAMLSVTGGDAPYNWNCVGLPSGLEYMHTSSGSDRDKLTITGDPTVAGVYTVTVSCMDMYAEETKAYFTLTVIDKPQVTTSALPNAKVGSPYTASISASGGTGSYRWTLSGASWLKLDSTTGNTVTISGTPDTAGTSTVSLTVTDANNKSETKTLQVKVIAKLLSLRDQTGRIGQKFTYTINVGGGLECIINECSGLPDEIGYTTHDVSPKNDVITISGTPRHFGVYNVKLRIEQVQNDYAEDYSIPDEGTFTLTIYDENGDMPSAKTYGSKETHGNSENDAWEIDSVNTLVRLQTDVNEGRLNAEQYFKLTNDLDISSRQDWMPIGGYVFVSLSYGQPQDLLVEDPYGAYEIRPFLGNFDGGGHTIKININKTKKHSHADYEGLFGKVAGSIKNLSVTGNISTTLTGGGVLRSGGIAALLIKGSISNCTFDGNISATNDTGDVYAGGIAGNAGFSYYTYSVTNCKTGSVSDTSIRAYGGTGRTSQHVFAGGIVGGLYGGTTATGITGTVTGNYSKATLTGTSQGLIGGYSVHTGQETLQLDLSNNSVVDFSGNDTDPNTQPNNGTDTNTQPGIGTNPNIQPNNGTNTNIQPGNGTNPDPQPGNDTTQDPTPGSGTNPDGNTNTNPENPGNSGGGGGGGGCNAGIGLLALALTAILMKRNA